MELELTVMFERTDEDAIAAWIVEIPGVASQGRTYEEARTRLRQELDTILRVRRKFAGDQLLQNRGMRREFLKDA
jgi:predicted RNase H-like HicB family nuclease